ncbi:tight adherence protein C [Paenibacillus sp. UNCCL117]|uniref:type II secretion system F family protein n=1 Tax=unclassified Paenibacillus TaxID=185978 RepID=UPI000881EEFE|nr:MULTISPECIES: type II secretion system F family protein [unclassified Paenibacillus]SDC47792.1 tight adherence protein C [Paenibacillus sp. cl123]SFW12063.1 tight adherence protein C [Paenibacillus sp. UNCCL117]
MLALMLLQAIAVPTLAVRTHRGYAPWLKEEWGLETRDALYWLGAAALFAMERLQLSDRLSEPLHKVHQIMAGLHGARAALARTRWFTVRSLLSMWGCLAFFTAAGALMDGEPEMLVYGVLCAAAAPLVLYKQEQAKLLRKKRAMLIELPEVLNQLMLLVGAGETVQQAMIRIAEHAGVGGADNPLRQELSETAGALRMNASFTKAMEEFSKRCALQETTLFTTTLLLNYRRGGDEMLVSLRELSMTLWDKRKALAKTLGEEASSKLVFPMVLIFFVVMVIVAVPALLLAG